MLPLLLLSVLLVGVGSADSLPAEHPASREALVPGIIDFGAERNKDVLAAPSTARVREDFKITITTVWRGLRARRTDGRGDDGERRFRDGLRSYGSNPPRHYLYRCHQTSAAQRYPAL